MLHLDVKKELRKCQEFSLGFLTKNKESKFPTPKTKVL